MTDTDTDTGTVAALAGDFHFSDEQVRPDRPTVYAELGKDPPRWSDAYGAVLDHSHRLR